MSAFPLPTEFDVGVVVYLTPWCPYCKRARSLLDQRGIAYAIIDVTDNRPARTWLRQASGQTTVPQIFVRTESIGGYTELSALDRSGELGRMLAQA